MNLTEPQLVSSQKHKLTSEVKNETITNLT